MARRRSGRTDVGFPEEFLKAMSLRLGSGTDAFTRSLQAEAPTSIRVNPLKPHAPAGEAVPWCSTGRYLPDRPPFTLDPLFHAGTYYVQEASSMLLEQAVHATGAAHRPIAALDLCAAPGGKTTLLRTLLDPASLLVSNEVDNGRRKVLEENVWKWGWPGVVVTGSSADRFGTLAEAFDLVVVDAPCSGEGLMRKGPFARQQWSPALVDQCARTQRTLLPHAWSALAPGGHSIYSTCTFEEAENDHQLQELVQKHHAIPVPIVLEGDHGVLRTAYGLACMPHRVRGEGFFIGVLRKPGNARSVGTPSPGSAPVIVDLEGTTFAYPQHWEGLVEDLMRATRVTATSTPHLDPEDTTTLPHPGAAFIPPTLRDTRISTHEVDLADALRYLRGETLPAEDASGGTLVHTRAMALAGRRAPASAGTTPTRNHGAFGCGESYLSKNPLPMELMDGPSFSNALECIRGQPHRRLSDRPGDHCRGLLHPCGRLDRGTGVYAHA